jgi:heat shock protein HslJ
MQRRQVVKYYCFIQLLVCQVRPSARIIGVLFFIIIALFNTASAGEVQGPTAKDLEGVAIRLSLITSGTVTLKNGEYRGPAAPGSVAETVVRLTDWRAFGSMNGKDAAAIVLVTDPGGSGMFYDLALLMKGNDGWINSDTVLLGDRVKVHSVSITNNEITASMIAHGPDDPMCCPTQEVTHRLTVQADRLVAKHDARPGAQDARIVGTVWQWVQTRYSDDTTRTPPTDAAGYTLQLNPDGRVKIRGDCNAGGGTFNLNGSKLSIAITHTTRAACPEGSLEDPFILDLNRVDGFLVKNGRLFLDLKLDTGTMEFQHKEQKAKEPTRFK